MCKRPCWGTPEEIKKIIDAGFGDRLMADYWGADEDIDKEIFILCGACKGYEGKKAPFCPSKDFCTFFKNGKCELHDLGLKPLEGRVADCQNDHSEVNVHTEVAKTWNTEEGRKIASAWMESRSISTEPDLLEMLSGSFDLFASMISRDINEYLSNPSS